MTSPQTVRPPAPKAAAKKAPAKPRAKKQPARSGAKLHHGQDREERIRLVAYALYEARGCADGHALDDWLLAQAQLEQATGTAAPADAGSSAIP